MIGRTIGHYTIVRQLGKGGMGEVYAAEDTTLNRKIALKIVRDELSTSPERMARFEREARAIAALNHPNIVTIFSLEKVDGFTFITMELVEGQTLAEQIPAIGMPLPELLATAMPIVDALSAAHKSGIIHRDLKPANIMITKEGRVKLLDFGLAKLLQSDASQDSEMATRDHTEAGVVMGTVPYMAPEQLEGMPADHRTDIFSLGIILYEMATGHRPFQGDSIAFIITSILRNQPKSVSTYRHDLPHQFENLLQRCLEKDRSRRFPSVEDISEELKKMESRTEASRISAAPPRHNLPIQLTSFIGRAEELQHVKGLLRKHRFITLVGAGGSGKTRLALQVCEDLLAEYQDGIWLIDLAPVSDPTSVARSVASVLQIPESSGKSLIVSIGERILEQQLLLLLDNCEHVLEATSVLLESLLRVAPGLRVLATSREAFNIGGEIAWRVPSLSLPDLRNPPPFDSYMNYEAIRLFVERSKTHQQNFSFTEQNAPIIAQICIRLDGVPLAIELAAARTKLLSPQEILKRLEDRFRLLTGGTRTALPRQQTLRAAVDWSHDLLREPERILLRRLSIFSGGFGLEAMEGVCATNPLEDEDLLQLLTQLVEKSLVVAESNQEGAIRYHLLETLRQYGQEKLEAAGESHQTSDAHLNYFLAMAEQSYARRIDESTLWLERIERNYDNFRSALEWCQGRYPEKELQLAGALGWFWYLHSEHIGEGRERLARAIDGRVETSSFLARALWGAAMASLWQTDTSAALPPAEKSLKMWRELNNPMEAALALEALGWVYFFSNDNPASLRHMQESLNIMLTLGNARLINRGKVSVAQVLIAMGNVEEVELMAGETLMEGHKLGEPRDIHYSLHFLGDCSLYRGDSVEAEQRYGRSLRAALDYQNVAEAAVEMQGMAMALAGQGRIQKAFRLNGAAEAKSKATGFDLGSSLLFWKNFTQRYLDPRRLEMGTELINQFETEGREMGFEAAVEYALDANRD